MLKARIQLLGSACCRTVRYMRAVSGRERDYLLTEMSQVRGLMPLLMKPRNRERWSATDKAELRTHLLRLRYISPYLALSIVPGSFIALPLLAWWLDRRRTRMNEAQMILTSGAHFGEAAHADRRQGRH